jgi:membrane protein implicated in regulation of membrane protease activity
MVKAQPTETDKPLLNQRIAQYVVNIYALEHSIENGSGRVWVGDRDCIVKAEEMPIGSRVKVTGTKGASLSVEKLVDRTH